jgi:transcription termination factor Rho
MSDNLTKETLDEMKLTELRKLAKDKGIKGASKMNKSDLVTELVKHGGESADHPRRVVAQFESLPVNVDLSGESSNSAAAPVRPVNDRPPVRPPSTINKWDAGSRDSVQQQARAPKGDKDFDVRRAFQKPAQQSEAQPQPREREMSHAPQGRSQREGRHRNGRRRDRDRDRSSEAHEQVSVQSDLEQSYFQKGILDIVSDSNYGFIRQRAFHLGNDDIYISMSQIKKFGLRTGDMVSGYVRTRRDGERYPSMVKIEAVNDRPPDEVRQRLSFEDLVPIYPNQRLLLECDANDASTRLIDLFAPVGLGTRGIIVAKPKAGKTIMLKKIANSLANNHPDVKLIAVLIDERPEEVTDFERSVKGEVISSTFDDKPEHHIQVAEQVIEYAKRKVESGQDVVILLDSLTRMARAHNLTCPPSGKTLSGGLDPNSLYKPKSFLGAARNIEGGGSLTILATALIETGSRLDDIIFEEFKGTANMELHLSRELADKRIFPAIDIMRSGTRHEELLYNAEELEVVWRLRRMVADMDEADRMNRLITKLLQTKSNMELLFQVRKATE